MDKDENMTEVSSNIEMVTGIINSKTSGANLNLQHNRNIIMPHITGLNENNFKQQTSPKHPSGSDTRDGSGNNKKKFFLLHKLHQTAKSANSSVNANNNASKQAKAAISNTKNASSMLLAPPCKNYVNRSTSISGNDLDVVGLLNKKKLS